MSWTKYKGSRYKIWFADSLWNFEVKRNNETYSSTRITKGLAKVAAESWIDSMNE